MRTEHQRFAQRHAPQDMQNTQNALIMPRAPNHHQCSTNKKKNQIRGAKNNDCVRDRACAGKAIESLEERIIKRIHKRFVFFANVTMLENSIATVSGPMPPGTGAKSDVFAATARSTSPTNSPASLDSAVPQSITTAKPGCWWVM